MLPFEMIRLKKEQNRYMQEAFLVETRSISGYSGSPVFVYKPEMKTASELRNDVHGFWDYDSYDSYLSERERRSGEGKAVTKLAGELTFLGVDCGHVEQRSYVLDAKGEPVEEGWRVQSNTGMAIVIPAWRLEDFLNTPPLTMKRIAKNDQYRKKQESMKSVPMQLEEPHDQGLLAEEGYFDALKRASRKTSEPEAED